MDLVKTNNKEKYKRILSVITIDEIEKWGNIVKSFKDFDVYYHSGYTRAFKIHGDGEPTLIYYEDQDIKAINVVMKRDISMDSRFTGKIPPNTYYDITTPYGYGGFLIEGKVTEESLKSLDHEYSSICKNEGIISEFVRFHPVLNNSENVNDIYDIYRLGKTITMNLYSQDQVWSNITSKNRNVIRKAKKSGVEIYWGRQPKLFDEFINLYNATMDKDNAKDYYYFKKEFYDSILHDLKYDSLMFYAVYEKKIIAMSMILYSNQQMHYHLSASDREYLHLAPTNLLLYEAACWGCENGFKTFHLGGGLGSKEDSLYKFKKAFNRNSDSIFSIGKKVFDQEKYDELVTIRSKEVNFDIEIPFFPKYRASE
ncbi:GNAT family N-acetyltransferase [Peribacillus frigoritolerans]|uniref:lipid II:glycine glycyltransferase FemX n=1 Tax=Peribacillus frigoritolerans TaxID=450367 RepID=UPI0020A014C9|nr:GNAT family N-acetyltransferase [Peribacillus frigoritolerans]MCP1154194.1 GNAT family N-acetyltransferase [Peribacillus frigoritolerans]